MKVFGRRARNINPVPVEAPIGISTASSDFDVDTTNMPRIMLIPTDKLNVDESYQRKPDAHMVHKISEKFDPDLLGIIVVSERNEKLWIVDGQHRWAAVKNFLKEVPCMLWQGLTYEEECAKFRKLNSNRKGLNGSIIFHEMVCEGDALAVETAEIIQKNRFDYNRYNYTTRENVIGSPMKMRSLLEVNGKDSLNRLLYINRKAWHGAKEGLLVSLLVGLNTFLRENPDVKNEYVINALSKTPPALIKAQATYYINADTIGGMSGEKSRHIHVANAIKAAYNKYAPKSERIV